MESRESTRQRVESSQPKTHADHIGGKGFTSMSHYTFGAQVYSGATRDEKFRMQKQQWVKNGKSSRHFKHEIWEKSRAKRRLFWKHKETKKKGHFATLMDMCHIGNAELQPKLQKIQGRVVLRGDIVKDDSGACAVFTEQGSSASQMTAAKVMDAFARLPDCDQQLMHYLLTLG